MHNDQVTEHVSATRIAQQLHRSILAPLGFERSGTTCSRKDNGLVRTLTFYSRPATAPKVQLHLSVAIDGLPDPVAQYRRDGLWANLGPAQGPNWYPRPLQHEPLPQQLLEDVSGPAVEFLLKAYDLAEYVQWAQEVYTGDKYRGWWGRFHPVMPQGTAPLQAAVFAATLLNDDTIAQLLTARIETEERDSDELARFRRELVHIQATQVL